MKKGLIFLLFIYATCLQPAFGQDAQFSQFYAAPLYLNPALAGSTDLTRVGVNYRNQWPALASNFTTYSVYGDHYFNDFNSGVGLLLFADQETNAGLSLYAVSLQYSYNLRITDRLSFRAGLEGSRTWKSADYSRLVFGDQLDNTGITNPVSGENLGGARVAYWDIAAGGFLYTSRLFLGYAAHHLLTPNVTLTGAGDPLPMKHSIHMGYKILLPTSTDFSFRAGYREVSLTPTFLYKFQGPFSQLDLGLYYTYEPIVLGLSYRGMPFNNVEGNVNNESIILLLGYSSNGLNIGYSFDYPISKLGIRSGGAHEVSVSYSFFSGDPRKPPKNVRQLPCPRF